MHLRLLPLSYSLNIELQAEARAAPQIEAAVAHLDEALASVRRAVEASSDGEDEGEDE